MGFKTIDLDTLEGMRRYEELQRTHSIKKAFEDAYKEQTAIKDDKPVEEIPSGSGTKSEPTPEKEQKTSFTEPIETPERKGVVTGVQNLRVRNKPAGEILFLVTEGSIIKILDDEEGWYKVETAPNRIGYVMKQFVKEYSEGG